MDHGTLSSASVVIVCVHAHACMLSRFRCVSLQPYGLWPASLMSPALAGRFFTTAPPGKPFCGYYQPRSCSIDLGPSVGKGME